MLEQIDMPQDDATIMYEDNRGALMMANAGQPTKRTWHIAIKEFALLDWVERDLLILETIATADNIADSLTKAVGKILFDCHFDIIMGWIIPLYARKLMPIELLKEYDSLIEKITGPVLCRLAWSLAHGCSCDHGGVFYVHGT
jgi:hypothetical protein